VRSALAEIAGDDRRLAIGANFTVEATRPLNSREAAIARLGAFYWNDESYNSLS
jgi:hypothetical protein